MALVAVAHGVCDDLGRVIHRAAGDVHALAGFVARLASRTFRKYFLEVSSSSCPRLRLLPLVLQEPGRDQGASPLRFFR